jgi:hypothetical protein
MSEQQEMPTGSVVCICGKQFNNEMQLEDHAREAHGTLDADEVVEYQCPECESTFATLDQLRAHWPSHGEPPDRPGHAPQHPG